MPTLTTIKPFRIFCAFCKSEAGTLISLHRARGGYTCCGGGVRVAKPLILNTSNNQVYESVEQSLETGYLTFNNHLGSRSDFGI